MFTTLLAGLIGIGVAVPGHQPQMARDGERTFLVVARDRRVGVLKSSDAGRTFREATPIHVSGRMAAGLHRGPRVAVTSTAVLVAVVAGPQGGGKDGDIVLYRSTDDGARWSAPVVVNDVPGAAREGLHAIAATPGGLVMIAWLDLRDTGTRLYGAVSRDHGATWSTDTLVYASPDGAICECCHPSVAADGEASLALMFRNHIAGSRDMYVTRSSDGRTFTQASKQGQGTWKLDACPMDGGGVVVDSRGVSSVWRRGSAIILVRPGAPEHQVGIGRDPVVSAVPAALDLAWITPDGIILQRGTESRLIGVGRSAALLAFESHSLLAWEQHGSVVTQVVPRGERGRGQIRGTGSRRPGTGDRQAAVGIR